MTSQSKSSQKIYRVAGSQKPIDADITKLTDAFNKHDIKIEKIQHEVYDCKSNVTVSLGEKKLSFDLSRDILRRDETNEEGVTLKIAFEDSSATTVYAEIEGKFIDLFDKATCIVKQKLENTP